MKGKIIQILPVTNVTGKSSLANGVVTNIESKTVFYIVAEDVAGGRFSVYRDASLLVVGDTFEAKPEEIVLSSTAYKQRCSDCAYLIEKGGLWFCDRFGAECKNVGYCPEVSE